MKVVDYRQVPAEVAENIDGVTVRWVISEADAAPHFAMRVFEVQPGQASPFHSHWQEHEVFVLAGRGHIQGADQSWPIEAGTVAFIPSGELHQLVNDGDEVLRFICCIPHNHLQQAAKTG